MLFGLVIGTYLTKIKSNFFLQFSDRKKRFKKKKRQMFKNQLDFCQQFLIYRNITTPSEQYRKPKKVYIRYTL